MKPTKDKMVKVLKAGKIELWNRWRRLIGYEIDLYLADLRDADLHEADLREANLYRADLREADLRDADLRDANLYMADLRDVDLRDADLRDADLRRADLREADLRRADLREADLHETYLLYMRFWEYDVYITKDKSRIGCQYKENSFWLSATIDEVKYMACDAVDWWKAHGEIIKTAIKSVEGV